MPPQLVIVYHNYQKKAIRKGQYLWKDLIIRSKALDRSLEVTIPEEVYDRLQKEMESSNG